MNIDWIEVWSIGRWFITSAFGAIIVKCIDAFFQKSKEQKQKKNEKINRLIAFVDEYANLSDLYRLYGRYSSKFVTIENPDPNKNWLENSKVEKIVLEPEERFVNAITKINGKTLEESITERILNLKLSSAQVTDLSDELDPSCELSKKFGELFIKTALTLNKILEDKSNISDPFVKFVDSLKEAEAYRKSIRLFLEKMKS